MQEQMGYSGCASSFSGDAMKVLRFRSSVATLFWRGEASDACPNPDSGRKHVAFDTGPSRHLEAFSCDSCAYCPQSALARALRIEIQQH